MLLSNFRNYVEHSETNYFIKINIQWMGFNTYCGTRKKTSVRKKSELVELSRASRFSRSLARLASGSFQLVSSPVYDVRYVLICVVIKAE